MRLLPLLFLTFSALAAPLEISIVDRAGAPLRDVYAGVVAAAQEAWSTPVAETVGAGDAIRFDLAPGRYRIVAGARGYDTHLGAPLEVPPSGRFTRIVLESLGSTAGQVVDVAGKPVAGARIGAYFDVLPDHPRELSTLGRNHLRANHVVTSDADGLFELPVPSQRATVVLIEADGMAPIVVDEVTAGSDRLRRVALTHGAALRVQWNGNAPGEDARLELVPLTTTLDASLPVHRAVRLWRRGAGGGAWPSLPRGTYEVTLRTRGDEAPIPLTRVTLTDSTPRTISVALPATRTNEAQLLLDQWIDGVSATRWRAGRAAALDVTQTRTAEGSRVTFADCAAGDVLVFLSRQRVASATIDDCANVKPVASHSRAELRLRFEDARVREGTVIAAACEGDDVRMRIPFVVENELASIPFPAGCSSVTVAARRFAPAAAGTIQVAAGQRHELTVRDIRRAASLLVHVLDRDARPAAGARVVAVRPEQIASVRSMSELARTPHVAAAVANDKGWAAFPDLDADVVQLLALTADGKVAHVSPLVHLTRGEERIERVDVQAMGSVRVELKRDEASSIVDVGAVSLHPVADSPWPKRLELRAPTGGDGAAAFDAVPAGAWIASANARLPRGNTLSIGRTRVDVPPGTWITASIPLADLVHRGTIRGRGEAIDGMLLLERVEGGSEGNQAALVERGRFAVLLEKPGTFRVAIQRQDGSRIVVPRPVDFTSSGKEVEIVLGDARITGRVETPDGLPVANVRVNAGLDANAADAMARTDAEGRFVLDALAAGTWTVRASLDNRRSESASVAIAEGTTRDGVTLVLRELSVLRGTVTNANGTPVRGAHVLVFDVAAARETLTARSNERGEFELKDLRALEGVAANVVVIMGDSAFVRRTELRNGMQLSAPLVRGTALLRRSDAPWHRNVMAGHFLVGADGAWVSVGQVSRISGDTLVVQLPPGAWRYVIATTPQHHQLLRTGNGNALPAAATLVIDPERPVEAEIQLQ